MKKKILKTICAVVIVLEITIMTEVPYNGSAFASDPSTVIEQTESEPIMESEIITAKPMPGSGTLPASDIFPETKTDDSDKSNKAYRNDENTGEAPENAVFDEDKEAYVESTKREYPKWQSKRKKIVKDYNYFIRVNKRTNTVTVYVKEENGDLKPYKAMVCSIGRTGHDTPEGEGFKTSDYYDWRLMVDGTYGRYAVRFNGSIMFHSVPYYEARKNSLEWQDYNKLGRPASLGCIRLAVADAKWIFDNCKRGTEVEVYSGPASTDPLGTPEPIRLDTTSEYRDWDPTDLVLENPWLEPVE